MSNGQSLPISETEFDVLHEFNLALTKLKFMNRLTDVDINNDIVYGRYLIMEEIQGALQHVYDELSSSEQEARKGDVS